MSDSDSLKSFIFFYNGQSVFSGKKVFALLVRFLLEKSLGLRVRHWTYMWVVNFYRSWHRESLDEDKSQYQRPNYRCIWIGSLGS